MNVFVGKEAIDFTASVVMPDNTIEEEFNFKKYLKGRKGLLFFYPLDFTFVCPSEIIAFNNKLGEFVERNISVISVSIDSHFSHLAWKNTPYEKGGIGHIQFPMVSDITKEISKSYNVLNDEGVALRGSFIVDNNFILRHASVNDLALGRNIDEYLRIIDAIIHVDKHGEVCPAGWKKGETAMDPPKEGISDYLSSNADKL